jgi:DNA-binding TFAR19-related protein (PDSD5 family)
LKQQSHGAGQSSDSGNNQSEDDQRKQQEEQRASILNQILEPEAADRLGRIRMVKESRARDVEERLIMLARSGQLRSKVNEDQLKQLLSSLTEHEEQSGKTIKSAKVMRRNAWDDDDLDDLLEGV